MQIIIYGVESTYITDIEKSITRLQLGTAKIINSEKQLFQLAINGIDILIIPECLHETASYLSSMNHCMQVIYLAAHTTISSLFTNIHYLQIPFVGSFLNSTLNKAGKYVFKLANTYTYIENSQRKSLLKNDINYICREKNQITIYFEHYNSRTLNENFQNIISYFPPPLFVIPHPNFIVQTNKIYSIEMNIITLLSGTKIPLFEPFRIPIMSVYLQYHVGL